MCPADQFEAMKTLIDYDRTTEDVAAAFGLSPLTVPAQAQAGKRLVTPRLFSLNQGDPGTAEVSLSKPAMTNPPLHRQLDTDALIALGRFLQKQGYRFITATPTTHQLVNARPGNALAADLAGIFGWSRLYNAELLPAHVFDLMRKSGVAEAQGKHWRSLVRASTLDDQLYFHSAYPTEESDSVFFGPDTYRFARAIRAHLQGDKQLVNRAIDIGAGAGPGAILIARAFPDAEVLATDINPIALQFAEANATLAQARNVRTSLSNLFDAVDGEFDLIVANPPYLVDPGRRAYRHGEGAFGEEIALAIIRCARERLRPGGTLLLYTGAAVINGENPFLAAAGEIFGSADLDWDCEEIDPDVFGEELAEPAYSVVDRIAAVQLLVRKR